ncbi:MAG: CPBP family intramembrane metalloprotease [bacterium]|nr:CPBP family intramembrane metalloprotease [bacterium]
MSDLDLKTNSTTNLEKDVKVPTLHQLKEIFFLSFFWIFLCELILSATSLSTGYKMFFLSILLPLPTLVILAVHSYPIVLTYRFHSPGWKHLLLAIPIGLSASIVIDGIDRLWIQWSGLEQEHLHKLYEKLRTNDWYEFNTILFTAVFVAPFTEEMLFRGVLQGTMEYRKSMHQAITWTAIIFTILHFNLEQIVSLWMFAILLSFMAWRVDSIFPSMIVHMINNGLSFYVLQYRLDGSLFDGYLRDQIVAPFWFMVATLLLSISAWFYFKFDHPLQETV